MPTDIERQTRQFTRDCKKLEEENKHLQLQLSQAKQELKFTNTVLTSLKRQNVIFAQEIHNLQKALLDTTTATRMIKHGDIPPWSPHEIRNAVKTAKKYYNGDPMSESDDSDG